MEVKRGVLTRGRRSIIRARQFFSVWCLIFGPLEKIFLMHWIIIFLFLNYIVDRWLDIYSSTYITPGTSHLIPE